MKVLVFIFFTYLFASLSTFTFAGTLPNDVRFTQIGPNQGLPTSTVWEGAFDSNGYIWLTSDNGLLRYDGYEFKAYRSSATDSSSLSQNSLRPLYIDRTGNIWTGGFQGGGLNRYDPDTETFQHYVHDPKIPSSISDDRINTIYEDSKGVIWVGTLNGLNRLLEDGVSFKSYLPQQEDLESLCGAYVHRLLEDSTGNLWVVTQDGGACLFDPKLEIFKRYPHIPDDRNTLASNVALDVIKNNDGDIWIATFGGVSQYNQAEDNFSPLLDIDGNPIPGISLWFDEEHDLLYIGSFAGLYIYDPASENYAFYENDPADQTSLGHGFIWEILEAADGNLWMTHGLQSGVISVLMREPKKINHVANIPSATSIVESQGDVYVASRRTGLHIIKTDVNEFKLESINDRVENSDHTRAINILASGDDGNIILGTLGSGLVEYDVKSQSFSESYKDESTAGDQNINNIWAILAGSNGYWLGTWSGHLLFFNSIDKSFDIKSENLGTVRKITRYKEGELLIATDTGLYTYIEGENQSRLFSFGADTSQGISTEAVSDVFLDSQGTIWVSSNSGLKRIDKNGEVKNYYEEDGLADNSVLSVSEDELGNLWIATNGGLSKFDSSNEKFRNYTRKDGLTTNNLLSLNKLSSESYWVISPFGLDEFKIDELIDNPYIPPVIIDGASLFREPLAINENGPLTQSILKTDTMALDYGQNTLSFSFVALNFTDSGSNQYQYKLEGLDEDWSKPQSDIRQATYTNLDPGKYTFRVIGSNNDGVWNNEGDQLTFTISGPWWSNIFVQIILSLGLILLLMFVFWLQQARLRRNEKVLQLAVDNKTRELLDVNQRLTAAKIEADKANSAKSEFLANISHEIRTPMNAIMGFSEILLDRGLGKDETHFTRSILKSGKILLSLINDVLDLSKIESGKLELLPKSTSVKSVVEDVQGMFMTRTIEKGISLKTEFSSDIPRSLMLDGLRLKQVLINLVSNAVKFTKEGGITITLVSSQSDTDTMSRVDLSICVMDTGVGIPEDQVNEVMKPFVQVKKQDAEVYGGTGLGLSITHKLVTMMGGQISVESKQNQGTTFKIEIPSVEISAGLPEEQDSGVFDQSIEFDKANILIVDDYEMNRQILSTYLSSFNFNLYQAKNGALALEHLEQHGADLVLLDMKMPVMDGYELAKKLSDDSKLSNIPIIAVTASALKEDESTILELCDGYLRKPISKKDLIEEIKRFIAFRETERSQIDKGIGSEDDFETIYPSKEILTDIQALADIGDVGGIADYLVQKDIPAEFPWFAKEVAKYVENFEIDELNAFLKKGG